MLSAILKQIGHPGGQMQMRILSRTFAGVSAHNHSSLMIKRETTLQFLNPKVVIIHARNSKIYR